MAERTAGRGARGVPQLAMDAAVEVAKVPWKVAVSVTKGAAGLVQRGLRL